MMEQQTCREFIEVYIFKPVLGNGFQQRNTYILRHMEHELCGSGFVNGKLDGGNKTKNFV